MSKTTIKEYIEAAYLHGLCVENLDTGQLEPPRDIADVAWIADKIQELLDAEVLKGRIDEHRILDELAEKTANVDVDKAIDDYGEATKARLDTLKEALKDK